MRERPPSSSLVFLAFLIVLAVGTAVAGGITLYIQNRLKNQTQGDTISRGRAANAPTAIAAYGCGSCHMIPGIHGANGKVGPDLTGIAKRTTIAGSLPNDPETMVKWIRHPQHLRPGSGMPEMGVTNSAARDIVAYLYARS